MSILIKGMGMPTSCLNCFLSRSGCRAVLKRMRAMEAGTWIPANYRHDDCPLVSVPTPHGRLIDETNILKVFSKEVWGFHTDFAKGIQSVLTEINAAPTIIQAEEGIK